MLEPHADGFRNYVKAGSRSRLRSCWWIGRSLLTLTAPEMTVLVGGMRVLNANFAQSPCGVLTTRSETLTNDFFVNLLDLSTECVPPLRVGCMKDVTVPPAKLGGPPHGSILFLVLTRNCGR